MAGHREFQGLQLQKFKKPIHEYMDIEGINSLYVHYCTKKQPRENFILINLYINLQFTTFPKN